MLEDVVENRDEDEINKETKDQDKKAEEAHSLINRLSE